MTSPASPAVTRPAPSTPFPTSARSTSTLTSWLPSSSRRPESLSSQAPPSARQAATTCASPTPTHKATSTAPSTESQPSSTTFPDDAASGGSSVRALNGDPDLALADGDRRTDGRRRPNHRLEITESRVVPANGSACVHAPERVPMDNEIEWEHSALGERAHRRSKPRGHGQDLPVAAVGDQPDGGGVRRGCENRRLEREARTRLTALTVGRSARDA